MARKLPPKKAAAKKTAAKGKKTAARGKKAAPARKDG